MASRRGYTQFPAHLRTPAVPCSGLCVFPSKHRPSLSRRVKGAGTQVFAPGVLLVVLRGARCTFVFLSGPVWAQGGARRRTRTVLLYGCIPVNKGYVSTDCLPTLPPPPALSHPVLSLEEPQGKQMHLPEIHTSGPDAYLPHLQDPLVQVGTGVYPPDHTPRTHGTSCP
ncbi:hypothetical protein Q8A73_013928 [Channa argus]|nr:hypothetical protein Q8A73_013928 [Channa argus]